MQGGATPLVDASSGSWDFAGEPAPLAPGVVTLVEGSTFCVSGPTGDMEASSPQGLFFRDTRVLSTWRLRVDGQQPQLLSLQPSDPYRVRFVGRLAPRRGHTDTELIVERERFLGDGMREDVRLRNLAPEDRTVVLTIEVDADFADVFAVKESRRGPRREVTRHRLTSALEICTDDERMRGVRVAASGARPTSSHSLQVTARVPARGDWSVTLSVLPIVDGAGVSPSFVTGPVEQARPALRLAAWREGSPRWMTSDRALNATLDRSREDLGGLRIFDPEDPGSVAVAAGAPWFMALFGRDSLLTSYMALPLDPGLALGTLRMLARHQGERVDADTEEEPGRILHETRFGDDAALVLGRGNVYYGTADATPLFVMLLGELARWGIAREQVEELLPHADRALTWIDSYGDRDGDGFVEYARATERGLQNQGWKDSHDGVNFADGTLPTGPIALCEVQGYVYAAYLARAFFAQEAGDTAAATRCAQRAADLKTAFNERFWLPDRGWYAVALDGSKRPVDALTSNIGHCLWSGIVDEDKAAQVAEHLMSPEMFSGWGVRTLATTMGAYNPMSYHNGSVWPHDNALIAAGLMRYGFVDAAQRVACSLLDAADAFGGRLPELFAGFDRADYPVPIAYPTACSPQAWAAAAPVQFVRTLLRLDPWMSHREVWFAPAWPRRYGSMRIDNLPLAGSRATVHVNAAGARLDGLPDDVTVHREPRRPETSLASRSVE